jgi:hypothetical protein
MTTLPRWNNLRWQAASPTVQAIRGQRVANTRTTWGPQHRRRIFEQRTVGESSTGFGNRRSPGKFTETPAAGVQSLGETRQHGTDCVFLRSDGGREGTPVRTSRRRLKTYFVYMVLLILNTRGYIT